MKAGDAEYDALVRRFLKAANQVRGLPAPITEADILPITEPKKRGRPKGSKNKPKVAP